MSYEEGVDRLIKRAEDAALAVRDAHMEQVEIVAREIRLAYSRHAAERFVDLLPWDEMPDERKDKWREMAQAAIEVMRS